MIFDEKVNDLDLTKSDISDVTLYELFLLYVVKSFVNRAL